MGQIFKWKLIPSGPALSNKEEPGFDLYKETKLVAPGLTDREVSDYLYEFGNQELDMVVVVGKTQSGTVMETVWPTLKACLGDDTEPEKYGLGEDKQSWSDEWIK